MTTPEQTITKDDLVDLAVRGTTPHPLDEGAAYVVVDTHGVPHVIDRDLDQYRAWPRRKTGTYHVTEASALIDYLGKHATAATELWADRDRGRVTAVINAHDDQQPGWGDHKVVLTVKPTPAWTLWTGRDGKLGTQATFAELIEDRAVDIVEPAAADMLELAQTFQATIGVTFESSKRLSSGERQLEYKETIESRAGRRGQLDIPSTFVLALAPYEGGQPFKVTARLRYRISEGSLVIGYKLDRPEDVLREAFASVLAVIERGVEAPIFAGPGTS